MPGILVVPLSLLMFLSCKKKIDKAIDCLGESLLTSVHHSNDNANPKKVDFTIRYAGEHNVSYISIDYGDGQTAPLSGDKIAYLCAAR